MAHRFMYLVLTILALQLGWSAVAAYCGHETGRAAQHVGHHSSSEGSVEEGFAANGLPAEAMAADTLHTHCSSCAHATLSFEGLPGALAIPAPARPAPSLPALRFSSPYPAPPERPQWIAAV